MRHLAGSCRIVFNKALALQKERHERGEKKLGYAGLCKLLTGWRNGVGSAWLADAPVHPMQQALTDLERASTNFFALRADFPNSRRRAKPTASAFQTLSRSGAIRRIAACFCPNWAGCDSVTAGMRSARSRMSPSVSPAVSGMCPSRPSVRSSRLCRMVARSASTWVWPASPRSRMVRSTRHSTVSSGTGTDCAKRSRP